MIVHGNSFAFGLSFAISYPSLHQFVTTPTDVVASDTVSCNYSHVSWYESHILPNWLIKWLLCSSETLHLCKHTFVGDAAMVQFLFE